jgi:hypothetical protein
VNRVIASSFALIAFLGATGWAQDQRPAASAPTADAERANGQTRADRWRNLLEGKVPERSGTAGQHGPAGEGQQMHPPAPPNALDADSATVDAYRAALREYYTYVQKGLQHRQRVFVWQHYSSITIFVVVILLVAAGIYFAAVQFHYGLARGTAETTQFEAGTGGLKVSSPVLGVIILVISLAFFYLYLAFVYPIQEIF